LIVLLRAKTVGGVAVVVICSFIDAEPVMNAALAAEEGPR